MKGNIIGREEEQAVLRKALMSTEAEMIAVVGRRRVGKTFLVEQYYAEQLVFSFTGTENAPMAEQLKNFSVELEQAQGSLLKEKPKTWSDAFFLLRAYLQPKLGKEKIVVFFDELPWIDSRRSGFLRALSYFWNSWGVKQQLVFVVCGSAASWMIQKVINHKGGLYNRLTRRIFLYPFTLKETEAFLIKQKVFYSKYQILILYMSIGGIPHYLKEVEGDATAVQNINRICFSKAGLLRTEFLRLFPSLFSNPENHFEIIRALQSRKMGLTRSAIAEIVTINNGGGLTKYLEELVHSGFISVLQPFEKKKKDRLYRLTDPYTLFYLQFMEDKTYMDEDIWNRLSQTQAFKTWSGYAFENICIQHIPQLKNALGISGIYTETASFYKKSTSKKKGVQIDLVMNRNDHSINLFEMKFSAKKTSLTKKEAEKMQNQAWIFEDYAKSNKMVSWVYVCPFGLDQNEHSLGLLQKVITMDGFFQ